MVDDLQEGIIILDQNFEVLYNNNAVRFIFGMKKQDDEEESSLSSPSNLKQAKDQQIDDVNFTKKHQQHKETALSQDGVNQEIEQ